MNASGFGRFGTYAEIPLADSLGMLDINCKALVAMTELTLPYMREGAKILQLDSLSSFQPVPYINVYGATKAFVLSYSRALNVELKPRGIHCMAMCPGWVKTEFFDHAIKKGSNAVTYFNIMFTAEDVVRTGMRDLYRGKKDVSIHDFRIRAQVFFIQTFTTPPRNAGMDAPAKARVTGMQRPRILRFVRKSRCQRPT